MATPKARRELPSIIEFITDPQLLGLSLSPAQRTLHKASRGLPLTVEEHDLWVRCTGRATYPACACLSRQQRFLILMEPPVGAQRTR